MMENNTPKRLSTNKRYYEKKNREKCIEKGKCYYENNTEKLRKMTRDTRDYLMNKNIRKKNTQKFGVRICLGKTNKSWKNIKKYIEKTNINIYLKKIRKRIH